MDGTHKEVRSSSQQASANTETGQSNHLRSQSIAIGQINHVKFTNPVQDLLRRVRSLNVDGNGGRLVIPTSPDDVGGMSTPWSRLDAEGSSDEGDLLSRKSTSQGSVLSSCSSSGMANAALVQLMGTEEGEIGSDISIVPQFKEDFQHSSPPSVLVLAKQSFDQHMHLSYAECGRSKSLSLDLG